MLEHEFTIYMPYLHWNIFYLFDLLYYLIGLNQLHVYLYEFTHLHLRYFILYVLSYLHNHTSTSKLCYCNTLTLIDDLPFWYLGVVNQDEAQKEMNLMPDFGLFEASHMACPVLPQYHPKQLMELLNSGKIRWVKAILAHLVRCLGGGSESRRKTSTMGSFNDGDRSPR